MDTENTAGSENDQPGIVEYTGRFKSPAEIIADPHFISNLESGIEDFRVQRLNRPEAGPGYYYRRDWYDQMTDAGNFNPQYFLEHIERIWFRKSPLTSATRNAIQYFCATALQQTLEYYNTLEGSADTAESPETKN